MTPMDRTDMHQDVSGRLWQGAEGVKGSSEPCVAPGGPEGYEVDPGGPLAAQGAEPGVQDFGTLAAVWWLEKDYPDTAGGFRRLHRDSVGGLYRRGHELMAEGVGIATANYLRYGVGASVNTRRPMFELLTEDCTCEHGAYCNFDISTTAYWGTPGQEA